MKLEQEVSNVKVDGDISRNAVGIDTNNLGFILTIISTKLYSKPIESFIREITSNAWDSHIEAKTTDPVVISINHSVTDTNKLQVSIQDFGTGLSPERFEKVFKKAGSSTKRETNDQIGMFGIGRFSALSVADMVHIISNYQGKKYTYLMYKDGSEINIDLALEQDTTDPNGLVFSLDIPKRDWGVLKGGIINQLRYFDNVFVQGDYSSDFNEGFNKIKIQSYNTFLISSREPENNLSTILLGKVAYPVETSELHNYAESPEDNSIISRISSISKKISVKFDIGELQVTPNREQILYKEGTARVIIDRYKAFFQELKDIRKEELKDGVSFMSLYNSFESNYYNIPFGDEKISTAGLDYRDPVLVNGVDFPDYHAVRNLAKDFMGHYFNLDPFYRVSSYNEMKRYKNKITVATFLTQATSIPSKLALIERKFLREEYTGYYLGFWDGMNINKQLIKIYKKYLRRVDKNVIKLFLVECINIWNSQKHYDVSQITNEFRLNNKIQRSYGPSEKYYGVIKSNFNSSGVSSKETYKKAHLTALKGHAGKDGKVHEIVVVDSIDTYFNQYKSSIRQIISKHVTVVTGAKTSVKILLGTYPTLESWIEKNKSILRNEISDYKRYLEYTNTDLDVDNLIDIEKELKIKVGINTAEKTRLDQQFKHQLEIIESDYDTFGQTKSIDDLKSSLKHPNLLKIAEIVDSFPYKSKPSIKEIYSKSLLNYLKDEKLVDTNNKIIYS